MRRSGTFFVWTLGMCSLCAACAGSNRETSSPIGPGNEDASVGDGSNEAAVVAPVDPPVETQRFNATCGDHVTVEEQVFWFSGMTPPEEGGPNATLTLGTSSMDPFVSIIHGGCVFHDDWVYRIESVSDAEPPVWSFARGRARNEPREISAGSDTPLPPTSLVTLPGGPSARVTEVFPYSDGGYSVTLETNHEEADTHELTASAQDNEWEESQAHDHYLFRVRVEDEPGPFGCPGVHLMIVDLSVPVPVQNGETVTLRRDSVAALGDFRVRYTGWLEGIPAQGPHEQYAQVEVTTTTQPDGTEPEYGSCLLGTTTTVGGVQIEALDADHLHATLRISLAE